MLIAGLADNVLRRGSSQARFPICVSVIVLDRIDVTDGWHGQPGRKFMRRGGIAPEILDGVSIGDEEDFADIPALRFVHALNDEPFGRQRRGQRFRKLVIGF
ncbi:hypothetical protein FEP37_05820 [Burkholderia multivorans]|nr:hypothetical protein [Burkholderia multivorans]